VRARDAIAGVALAVACAWAGTAAAADEAAAAHYKKGRSLYNVSEYRAALEEFKQAYVAHEDPAFLYNIAQCHRQLGNHREAITFYKRFLNQSPLAPNRKEIERLIAELEVKAAQGSPPPPAPSAPPESAPPAPEAAPPAPPSAAAPPAATVAVEPPPAPEGHAGLHLEAALGGGAMHDDFKWLGIANGTANGGSGAFQLAVTYGLTPRFALGGVLATESVQSPKVETGGTTNDNVSVGTFALLGAVADLRLAPGPTAWHFEGGAGVARMSIKDKSGVVSPSSPVGGGVVLAGGYDWALGPNWQLGALARFLGASMSDQGYTHSVTAGSLLLCISRH
jgi:opacity protein-like surface antigen